MHIRAPPASGKTTLNQLLQQYYKVKWMKPTWDKLDEYPSSEENTFHYAWGNLDSLLWTYFNPNKKKDHLAPGTTFIIDKAQESYSDDLFWNSIIKERLDRRGTSLGHEWGHRSNVHTDRLTHKITRVIYPGPGALECGFPVVLRSEPAHASCLIINQ